jgi:hypothetical protein
LLPIHHHDWQSLVAAGERIVAFAQPGKPRESQPYRLK